MKAMQPHPVDRNPSILLPSDDCLDGVHVAPHKTVTSDTMPADAELSEPPSIAVRLVSWIYLFHTLLLLPVTMPAPLEDSPIYIRLPAQFWSAMQSIVALFAESFLPAVLACLVLAIFILGVMAAIGLLFGGSTTDNDADKKEEASPSWTQPMPGESTGVLDEKQRLQIEIDVLEDSLRLRREKLDHLA